MDDLCLNPWNYFCIEADGNCFFCCSSYLNDNYYIGNIVDNSLDEIWNGESALKFRQSVLKKEYTHCNINECSNVYKKYKKFYSYNQSGNKIDNGLPTVIQLNFDYTCDQKCIFCRDKINSLLPEQKIQYEKILNDKLLPIAENFKLLIFNGVGEFFNSKITQDFIKKVIEINPDCKFELYTNGIHCTPENLKKLNIEDKIIEYHVSVNAAKKSTYEKIFRSNNFNKVINNLEYISKLTIGNKPVNITLGFVINSINYKDMKKFVKLAKKLKVQISFTLTQVFNETSFIKNEREYAVFLPIHRNYNEFVDIINDDIFKTDFCHFDFNSNLKKISLIESLKNKFEYIKFKLRNTKIAS